MTAESDRFRIIVADITTLNVDVIVNAANRQLEPGGGVCGAVHAAAGPELARACRSLKPCELGEAKITEGFNLPSKFVIHAVGPIYRSGDQGEPTALASCYRRCLELAHEHKATSIAFPCISTGIFGYPLEDATRIALEECRAWIATDREPKQLICCCFSDSDAGVYERLRDE